MNKLPTIIVSSASFIVIYFIISLYMGLPIVHKSYTTNQCVEVWSPDAAHSCSNMPTKYETVWVK